MINPFLKLFRLHLNLAELSASMLLLRPKGQLITKTKKIKYGNTRKSVCDYIYPKEHTTKMPIMVYIHGGGWISGYRSVRKYYCYEYAEKGFFVVNIDYDYAPDKKHPYQINQILSVIDTLYDKKEELNINFEKLILAGDSAGAYLASMVAGIINCKPIEGISPDIKHIGDYKVKAFLSMCGAFSATDAVNSPLLPMRIFLKSYTGLNRKQLRIIANTKKYDLQNIINDNFPRTFIIKALNDKLMVESDNFERLLTELNVQFDSFLATGLLSFHCFPLMCKTTMGRECLQLSIETIKKYIQMS